MRNPIILLIDDSEFMRIFFKDLFWMHPGKHGDHYEVIAVKNIQQGLEAMKHDTPQMIFIEPRVPNSESSGFSEKNNSAAEFVVACKKDPKTSSIPIVAFSAFDDPSIKKLMLKSGVDEFIIKGYQVGKNLIEIADGVMDRVSKKISAK